MAADCTATTWWLRVWCTRLPWRALGATVAVLAMVRATPVHGLSEGIIGYSGKQGSTCNTCHSDGTAPVVKFDGPESLSAGALGTFRFVVESQSATQGAAGFNLAASGGVLAVLPDEGEQLMSDDLGGTELTHTAPKANMSGRASWQFTWQAPSFPGPQTLYGAGLSVNGNGTRSGDAATAATFSVTVTSIQSPTAIAATPTPTSSTASPTATTMMTPTVTPTATLIPATAAPTARPLRGDANCDGALSAADITATLLRGEDQLGSCRLGDVDCSGTVDAADVGGIIGALFEPPRPATCVEWPTYGQSQLRTFFNADETRITRDNVASLRFKWRYLTGAIVTASPSVAYVEVPGEGRIKVVFVPSWDGNLYALRAANGSQLWHFTMKPQPGGAFPYAASAEVARVAGEPRVYVAGGMTVYCLSAATGELRWEFDAGTGCTTCDRHTERNEIESSPTVVENLVYFAMDVNDHVPGKGGVYAVDATDGRLVWYFDMDTQATCRPNASDNVRRFDGFHTAAELGLPDDFFATRPGCNFDRSWTGCGNIWSSFSVDYGRRLIYTASGNCDTDTDPSTPDPPPPMPPYDEAIFAMTFDGVPVWVWRPRETDVLDREFGGVPNLFTVTVGGVDRDVIGVGAKDGVYYLLDRDGTNQMSGRVEPYWKTQTVPGGPIGGIIASAAVGDGSIFFTTAFGVSIATPQQPVAWSLRASDGAIRWSKNAAPSYGPTTAIPGVTFMGGVFSYLTARDADTGAKLHDWGLDQPVASAATVLDGEVFVGAGVGGRDAAPDDAEYLASLAPSYVTALCLPDSGDCPTELCDDGDPCTYDFHTNTGSCRSEPAPDGLRCRVNAQNGTCAAGVCQPGP
jgi:outer membrane protein assembly factor BamB